jgi:hypothetical protein
MVLRSPRLRRRLAWLGGLAAAAGLVVGVLSLLPEQSGKPPRDRLHGRATLPARQVPLRPAERRGIDATLDTLIGGAVAGRDPESARAVLPPGTDPRTVYRYPARGTRFHDWTLNESTPGHVSLDLLVQPAARAARRTGPVVFTIRLDQVGTRWRVESLLPVASIGSHDVTSAADFGPGLPKRPPKAAPLTKSWLGRPWLVVPVAVLALVVLFPIVLLLVKSGGASRAMRRYRRGREGEPLPWERPQPPVDESSSFRSSGTLAAGPRRK